MASLPSNCGSPPTTARAGVPSPAPCGNADESDEDHSGVGPKGMAIGGLAGVGSLRGLCSPLCGPSDGLEPGEHVPSLEGLKPGSKPRTVVVRVAHGSARP